MFGPIRYAALHGFWVDDAFLFVYRRGLLAFSRTVAAELRSQEIRVHTVKPGFAETEGFPQSWLGPRARRIVIGPEDVAAHVLHSLEEGRGESTVPWFYGPLGAMQDVMPNLFTLVLGRLPKAP
jgi:short-subunit dehydrogenase